MGGTPNTPTATASATGVPSPLGNASGMRTIPSRPLRTENTTGLPPMTKEQADLLMEMNRLRGGQPTPGVEHEGQPQQQNPAFPRLPYRGGAPPVPGR